MSRLLVVAFLLFARGQGQSSSTSNALFTSESVIFPSASWVM